jgi:hypothetical protein
MCPLYEYECPTGHIAETIRHADKRDDPKVCDCGLSMVRIISRPAGSPDGIYSYAPNIGDPDRFERQRQAIKDGTKVIKREHPRGWEPRE